jgi:hypothetical protein
MFWIPGDGPITDDRCLGEELIRAIATGSRWLLTEEDQSRLLQSAVTENQKQQTKQFVDAAKNKPTAITIINAGSLHVQFSVAQCNYESMEPSEGEIVPISATHQLPAAVHSAGECRDADCSCRN